MASLLQQECLRLDISLLENGAQRAFWHIAGMIRDSRVEIDRRIAPNFVTASSLAVKFKNKVPLVV